MAFETVASILRNKGRHIWYVTPVGSQNRIRKEVSRSPVNAHVA